MAPSPVHDRDSPPLIDLGRASLSNELVRFAVGCGAALREVSGYNATVRRAVSLAVPTLADLSALILPDSLHADARVEVHARSAAFATAGTQWIREHLSALQGVAHRVAAGSPEPATFWDPHFPGARLRRLLRDQPDLLQSAAELGIRSLIVLPLRLHASTTGVLALARCDGSYVYEAAELAAGLVIARHAAVAIDRAAALRAVDADSARRAQAQALQRWQHIFDYAPWGAAVLAPDGIMDAVNGAFAQMHGYDSPDALLGLHLTALVAENDRPALLQQLAQPAEGVRSCETMNLRADGETFPALVTIVAAPGADAERYRTAHVQDLTELKRAEDRLSRARRMEAVGRLAGGVAHEVNNMMTVILGFADLLMTSAELGAERRSEVEEIRRAAHRTARVTQQLLAFSRQQPAQPRLLDLNALIGDVVDLLRRLLPVEITVVAELEELDGSVRADRGQLEQVLINLAFNARDAMPGGGRLVFRTGRVQLDREKGRQLIGAEARPGAYAAITVSDTGTGISPETQAHLFEPFFTTKPVGVGTGLGLATVYGIVKQSGGYIWVRSEEGAGATFTICLPLLPLPAEATGERRAAERGDGGSGTVLLVEDEPAVRRFASRTLADRGYHVLEAEDGPQALAMLAANPDAPDLVLCDVVMPGMDGRELVHQLRPLRPDLPVLYMSGCPDREMVERGLLPEGEPFLQKPFDAPALLQRVRELLRQS